MLNRYILRLSVSILLLNACSTNSPNAEIKEFKQMSTLDTAKIVAASIISYVEQADTGLISKKEMDKKAKPLQKQLDSMRHLLSLEDSAKLDDYRTQLFSAMVDRKVKRKQK